LGGVVRHWQNLLAKSVGKQALAAILTLLLATDREE
jgi:hypothetical protein